jgi:hypothetical protein
VAVQAAPMVRAQVIQVVEMGKVAHMLQDLYLLLQEMFLLWPPAAAARADYEDKQAPAVAQVDQHCRDTKAAAAAHPGLLVFRVQAAVVVVPAPYLKMVQ